MSRQLPAHCFVPTLRPSILRQRVHSSLPGRRCKEKEGPPWKAIFLSLFIYNVAPLSLSFLFLWHLFLTSMDQAYWLPWRHNVQLDGKRVRGAVCTPQHGWLCVIHIHVRGSFPQDLPEVRPWLRGRLQRAPVTFNLCRSDTK